MLDDSGKFGWLDKTACRNRMLREWWFFLSFCVEMDRYFEFRLPTNFHPGRQKSTDSSLIHLLISVRESKQAMYGQVGLVLPSGLK